ncbi:hypothetical protein ACIQXI_04520 [Lysinibacillus sp. NPDC097195]|uniref:hypothetical protein n=1 Tax=Lysinibacillus sp. NPDC097195 TaxID=3364141 RepID=UPI0038102678
MEDLKKILLLLLMFGLLFSPAVAYAHPMDKSMLYSDISATAPNLQEIMVLHSIGLLGYNGVDMTLNRTENLSRKDFAAWLGGYLGLEGSNVEELALAAKNNNYISSLDGDITYDEINAALWQQKLQLDKPEATLTKDDYIAFLMKHLDVDVNGSTVLQMGGFTYGPTGTIEDVVTGDELAIMLDGKTYPLSGHVRLFADSTDPNSWIGQNLEKSIVNMKGDDDHNHGMSDGHGHDYEASDDHGHGTNDDHGHDKEQQSHTSTLQFIQIASPTQSGTELSQQQETKDTPKENETADTTSTSSSTFWITAVIILVVVVLAVFFIKRKK